MSRRSPSRPAGETACFLSHRECWKRVVEADLPFAVIFVDDVHFGADAGNLFQTGNWVPEGADIIKLETMRRRVKIDKSAVAFVGNRSLHRLRGFHAGAAAYIVTRCGAEKLLTESEKFAAPVDHFMFDFGPSDTKAFSIFQLVPAICCQDFFLRDARPTIGLGSDLHDERTIKPVGFRKGIREVKRPFSQLFDLFRCTKNNILTETRWTIIPFA